MGDPGQAYQLYGAQGLQVYPQAQQSAQAPQQVAANNAQLREFWEGQRQEVQQVSSDPAEFKNHQLPLARIKKIMKSDEDVRMIAAEAPVLFAKACEMFILELTLRSWMHAEENKRRTLQRSDVAAAIAKTDVFDFLLDVVPAGGGEGEGGAAKAEGGGSGDAEGGGGGADGDGGASASGSGDQKR